MEKLELCGFVPCFNNLPAGYHGHVLMAMAEAQSRKP